MLISVHVCQRCLLVCMCASMFWVNHLAILSQSPLPPGMRIKKAQFQALNRLSLRESICSCVNSWGSRSARTLLPGVTSSNKLNFCQFLQKISLSQLEGAVSKMYFMLARKNLGFILLVGCQTSPQIHLYRWTNIFSDAGMCSLCRRKQQVENWQRVIVARLRSLSWLTAHSTIFLSGLTMTSGKLSAIYLKLIRVRPMDSLISFKLESSQSTSYTGLLCKAVPLSS